MKLQEYLSETGLTQEAFAVLIDATQEQVSRYANGRSKPREEVMRAIFRATGGRVDANDFYGLPENLDVSVATRQTGMRDITIGEDAAE